MDSKDIIITGDWNGQPIWREKTPEEKMEDKLPKEKREGAELFSKVINKLYDSNS